MATMEDRTPFLEIEGRRIGPGNEPFVIAEVSANHNGSIDRALATIEAAARHGAHAVKIQTYTPDSMTIDCDSSEFVIEGGLWDGYNLYELYQEAHTPYDWHEEIFAKAREVDVTLFSTPFDELAVDLLEALGAPAYKIASFEAVDLPLIRYTAKTGKPIIISTGMASLKEIEEAVTVAKSEGCEQLALLHCVSSYPAPADQSNLMTIRDISTRFGVVSGLSDHTQGTAVAVAGVALGASIVEKHFQLDRNQSGPDSAFSIVPEELRVLCEDTRTAWQASGRVSYERGSAEEKNLKFRRSIYFVKDLNAGDVIDGEAIRRIRPGYGLPPRYFDELIGKRVSTDVARGDPVTWGSIKGD